MGQGHNQRQGRRRRQESTEECERKDRQTKPMFRPVRWQLARPTRRRDCSGATKSGQYDPKGWAEQGVGNREVS
eukprot:1059570-Pleurochrysis_carterae.AAC.1